MKTLNIEPHFTPDAPSKFYNTHRDLNLDTKLTLREFIQLFNDDAENPFWDQFYLQGYIETDDKFEKLDTDKFDVIKITPC